MHRIAFISLFTFILIGCSDKGVEPSPTLIIAKVHWGDQGIPNIPIVLVQTGDSLKTDSTGVAVFSVTPGQYTIRAYGINRGGPVLRWIDFDVEARKGETSLVDIIDCLPCL